MKALGPPKLTITLTDCLKSPSVDLRTPVVTYLNERDTVNPQNLDSLTLTNLDSGDITPMDQPVWDKDVDQWLDDLMDVLEDPSSLEDTLDLEDLLEDMTPEDWGHVIDDVMDSFDLDAFVS